MKDVSTKAADQPYEKLASDEQIERTIHALEAHNIHAIVVSTGEEAIAKVFELLPAGAEVFTAQSRTIDGLGITELVNKNYESVRNKMAKLDRNTQRREDDQAYFQP